MAHLLHIDSSIQGDRSVSRALTARVADAWRAAHPGGTVTYRDLAAEPLPHLDAESGTARMVAADEHTPAQARSYELTRLLVGEVLAADTVLLGLPLYNFGPPSTVKSWSTISSPAGCRSMPRRAPDCSAAATSWCSPRAEAATALGRRAKAGTTRSPGFPMA